MNGSSKYHARPVLGKPPSDWPNLIEHLAEVADRAARFVGLFGGIAGLLHDLGKYSDAFQRCLEANQGAGDESEQEDQGGHSKIDHSTAGAQYLDRLLMHIAKRKEMQNFSDLPFLSRGSSHIASWGIMQDSSTEFRCTTELHWSGGSGKP